MFLKKLINKGYQAQQCQVCGTEFKMIKLSRIHKCKRCLKHICSTCGSNKEQIVDEDGKKTQEKHRICSKCKADINLIKDTMRKYDMHWNRDSTLSLQWLAQISKIRRHPHFEYQHFLSLFFKSGDRFTEETEIIDKDVIKGRTDFSVFNYSMKEFFYTVQLQVEDQHTTRTNMAHVLYAVAARLDRIGYCQGMSGIAALLLCFGSEESAYIIFCDLLENIFPPDFFERSLYGVALYGMLAQIHFLKEYYEYFVTKIKRNLIRDQLTEQQMAHTKMVIELTGSKALLSVFIGILSFTNLIFVWEQLKKERSFEVIQKAFLAIIYLNRDSILHQRSFKTLEEYFENIDNEAFIETYFDIEIDKDRRQAYIEEYHEITSKKWNSSNTGNSYTLSKVTKLTEKEIKLLQKHICPNFTNQQLITEPVIGQGDFMRLVEGFYTILKRESFEGEPILEMSPIFLKKIFQSFLSGGREGLLFKEFICCLSICTKSGLKERICAIIITFKNEEGLVTFEHFNKLISAITALAPKSFELKKVFFLERMGKYFKETGAITIPQLRALLNDEFIFNMTSFIRSECKGIIQAMVEQYGPHQIVPIQPPSKPNTEQLPASQLKDKQQPNIQPAWEIREREESDEMKASPPSSEKILQPEGCEPPAEAQRRSSKEGSEKGQGQCLKADGE